MQFTDVDVAQDRAGLKRMVAATGQYGVPVIMVGDQSMVGWNPKEFDRLLKS
ncbi:MAG: hypothetical protein CVT66_03380 [Actinobacteria bacterium HGW-Actinobacteria-6]|nr:MAG: hypothetical protein CVT66_03380 [Actinobacteria bacterium HGW-Actinobacteria-6]